MYHKFRYGEKNHEVKKSKPKGGKILIVILIGWEEDDKDSIIRTSSSANNYQVPSFEKQEINSEKSTGNFNSNYSYKAPAKEILAKSSISL